MAVTETDQYPVQLRGTKFISDAQAGKAKLSVLAASGLFFPLSALLIVLLGVLGTPWLYVQGILDVAGLVWLESLLVLAGAGIIGLCTVHLQRNFLQPLVEMRHWALRMRQGEISARIPIPCSGEFAALATDLNSLCEEFKCLRGDLDSQVRKQTERLAQKNASLKILYDVAASINHSRDLDDLLLRFLRILKEMVGAKAATVRLVSRDNQMRLVGSIGLDDDLVKQDQLLPVQLCLCGTALSQGDILCQKDPRVCSQLLGRTMYGGDEIEMIAVPLPYQDRTLGVYNLFVEKPGISDREDILDLLISIGNHLGMAVEKARLDEESKHASIMGERTAFANELHDSLAQTLASLRFQVQVLHDILGPAAPEDACRQAVQIKNSLDEAHTELRELITHFRAPLDDRGLLPALEQLLQRFRRETKIAVFFQQEYHWTHLPVNVEMQVFRIVQECLANVRKHSQAHWVRVLLRSDSDGHCMILVEDDGIGFRTGKLTGRPGEHLGLSIMQERAHRLGGELGIESEPGEGTRIELGFSYPRGAVNV